MTENPEEKPHLDTGNPDDQAKENEYNAACKEPQPPVPGKLLSAV